jgi:hypothetical protein
MVFWFINSLFQTKNNCMKNNFTLLLLLICTGTLQAQLNKGTQLLTGNFNISNFNNKRTSTNETSTYNGFGAGIGVGRQWVHKENRIRGFQIGYDYYTNTQNLQSPAGENKRTISRNSFNVGYVSQYLLPFGKRFFGTATLLSQFAFGKQKEEYENNNNNVFATNGENYSLSFGIQPGLAYLLSKRWIADVTIGNLVAANVNHSRARSVDNANELKDRGTSFNLNSIFSGNSAFLAIGFRYVLR